MIYSSRLKRILEYCLAQAGRYVSVDELAELLKTSKRTVFRELHDVDEQLSPYGVHLKTQSGKGIHLVGDEEHLTALLTELNISNVPYLNKDERQNMLIFELLRSSEIQKLIHYANIFQVSEATISNDLDSINPWFKSFHITIIRKPGLGVELQGNEQDMRQAMRQIVHEKLSDHTYTEVNYLNSQEVLRQIFMNQNRNSIMKLLNQEILERILQVFQQYQHELQLDRYAQSSYIGLIIHLAIAIDRIQKHEQLSACETLDEMIVHDASYDTAQYMATLLENEFDIEIPSVETAFIALHIKGSKISYIKHDESDDVQIQKLALLISRMIDEYDTDIRYQLQQDEKLYQGLITHLQPAITRLNNGLMIYNPLLAQLKEQYPSLFQQSCKAVKLLEEEYDCQVSEDEIGFITMHIGASLERDIQTLHHRDIVVGVVCASGIGVSALLSARIAKIFHGGIILKTLSMEDVLIHDFKTCDVLVSTFALTQTSIPFVQVDPLLNNDNIKAIEEQLTFIRNSVSTPQGGEDIETFQQVLTRIHEGSEACLQIIENLRFHVLDDIQTIPDIIQQFVPIVFDDVLTQQGVRDALVQRERLGSLVLPEMGFALLHTKSEWVTQCMMHICYPRHHTFTQSLTDISFVMILLIPKQANRTKREIMSLLSRNLMENDGYRAAIIQRNKDLVMQHITQIFQDWFEQF